MASTASFELSLPGMMGTGCPFYFGGMLRHSGGDSKRAGRYGTRRSAVGSYPFKGKESSTSPTEGMTYPLPGGSIGRRLVS